jgi:hypothetical protein
LVTQPEPDVPAQPLEHGAGVRVARLHLHASPLPERDERIRLGAGQIGEGAGAEAGEMRADGGERRVVAGELRDQAVAGAHVHAGAIVRAWRVALPARAQAGAQRADLVGARVMAVGGADDREVGRGQRLVLSDQRLVEIEQDRAQRHRGLTRGSGWRWRWGRG